MIGGLLIFIANESWLRVNVNMCTHVRTKTSFSPLARTFIADDEEENEKKNRKIYYFLLTLKYWFFSTASAPQKS